MSKKEIFKCDVCGKTCDETNERTQVIFLTEQQEGRMTQPYFQIVNIDYCDKCRAKMLSGHYLFATGAQGYNKYFFENPFTVNGKEYVEKV